MTDREVMQMALETAEQIACADYRHWEELASLSEFERWARSRANHIAEALRTALAQPEPVTTLFGSLPVYDVPPSEPVACKTCESLARAVMMDQASHDTRREWVGLTDDEYELMAEKRVTNYFFNTLDYAHDIEAKLKEKNT